MTVFIFDLDGTLADGEHRVHHIQGMKKDWRAYFAACSKDEPIMPVIRTFKALRKAGADCWIWTGRSDEVRDDTMEWLDRYGLRPGWFSAPEALLMRPEYDRTDDAQLKYGWLANLEPPERNRVTGVFEDRDRVVAMWRAAGVQCFQVAPGAF